MARSNDYADPAGRILLSVSVSEGKRPLLGPTGIET